MLTKALVLADGEADTSACSQKNKGWIVHSRIFDLSLLPVCRRRRLRQSTRWELARFLYQ